MRWLRCHKMIVGLGFVLLLLGLAAAPPAAAGPRPRGDAAPVGSHAPDAGSYAPDAGSYAPDTDSYAPDAGSYAPDAGSYAPDTDSYVPDAGPRLPEAGARPKARTFKGRAFDTCRTPSADTMRRWLASPYRAVGVYFGGRGRACTSQPHLTRAWMRTVHDQGWRVLPLYVGSQSTCVFARHKKNVRIGRHPWKQGTAEARDAVRRASALGMGQGSPLFLDMEAYAYGKKKCARSTLLFVRGWNREVSNRGYLPGFYSSAGSGIRHMELSRRAGVRDLPEVVWFARWGVRNGLHSEPVLRRTAWTPARRIHQYVGNVRERHGGRTLLIDRNVMHAPVARID